MVEWDGNSSETPATDKAGGSVAARKYNLRRAAIRLIPFTAGSASPDIAPCLSFEDFSMRFTARAAIAAIAIATLWTAGPACSQPGLTLPARPDAATDKFASLDKAARRTISVACSKEADEQGLKGKARGKFRSACKRDKAAAAAAATPVPAPAPTPEKPK